MFKEDITIGIVISMILMALLLLFSLGFYLEYRVEMRKADAMVIAAEAAHVAADKGIDLNLSLYQSED